MLALVALGIVAYQFIAPRSHVLTLPRAANGVDYVLHVYVPPACRSGGCHALYVLDGLAWIPTFARIEDDLVARHRIEPLILVGVAYRDALNTGDLRKHDFTPAFGREPNRTGGADAFLAVLRDEIVPYAEAHLPIAPGERGLAGHSYAGLFAAYALARQPDFFDRYLIMSPALWFDDCKIYDVALAPSDHPQSVFLAADTPRGEARSDMANNMLRLNERLLAQSNLTVSHALILGETHNSMVAPATQRGLLALYGAESQ
ncbi:MAG: alpha/beta hydrolase-fold protein [Alphaproteobacteria bacterium]|nr:alpha/beta hydrolase-fold protein [Alphaproteobacteria bacterium]